MTEKSFELVAFVSEQGDPIEIPRAERVGYTVYEDTWQVVAEPFSDTPIWREPCRVRRETLPGA